MSDDRYSLVLEEARRALDRQAADVDGIRTRSAALVSVGALAAAFLGGLVVREGQAARPSLAAVVGAAAFVAVFASAMAVLWPRRFIFAQGSDVLVAWIDHRADAARMQRNLALHMRKHYRTNDRHLRWFTRFYRSGLIFLAVEIISLLIDLRAR